MMVIHQISQPRKSKSKKAPDGMSVDNFYFDENENLIKYENNDQPDKDCVKTGEKKVEGDNPWQLPSTLLFVVFHKNKKCYPNPDSYRDATSDTDKNV